MMVDASSGSGDCGSAGCVMDLNQRCPFVLKRLLGVRQPEYCCSGAYSTPETYKRSIYSHIFKSACPLSYSYAYDDATSTFTCTACDYTITFCPLPTLPKRYTNLFDLKHLSNFNIIKT
ncbi:Thaumatin-like protein 1 [Linum grandiflorum]